MDDSWDVLLDRLNSHDRALGKHARLALTYRDDDPHGSLHRSRAVLEKLLVSIHITKLGGAPVRPTLDELINNTQLRKHIPDRIRLRMKGIQDLGNLGTHLHDVTEADAARALVDLREILEWHLGPAPIVARGTANTVPRRRQVVGNEPAVASRRSIEADDPKVTLDLIDELERKHGFQLRHFRQLHHFGSRASLTAHVNYCRRTGRFTSQTNVVVAERLSVCLEVLRGGGAWPEAIATACRIHPLPAS